MLALWVCVYVFMCGGIIFKISPENFQLYNMAQLIIVTMLCIRFPQLINFIAENVGEIIF